MRVIHTTDPEAVQFNHSMAENELELKAIYGQMETIDSSEQATCSVS